jgi:hypothetical protein
VKFLVTSLIALLLAGCATAPRQTVVMPPMPSKSNAVLIKDKAALDFHHLAEISQSLCPPAPDGFDSYVTAPASPNLTNQVPIIWSNATPDSLRFVYWADTNHIYELQYTKSLSDISWIAYSRVTVQKPGLLTTDHPIYKCDSRFFRVMSGTNFVTFIHKEDFSSGVKPPNWIEETTISYHPASWNYADNPLEGNSSIALSDTNDLFASAVFYELGGSYSNYHMKFLVKFLAYPAFRVVEVCDLYSQWGQEICDIYIYPDGKINLYMGTEYPIGSTCEPVPVNTTIQMWIDYTVNHPTSVASVCWALVGEYKPLPGSFRYATATGTYSENVTKFLWGPISDGNDTTFVYDSLEISEVELW